MHHRPHSVGIAPHLFGGDGGVHEEHQAGIAELAGNGQALGGGEACVLEALFKIDLAAAAGEGWITSFCDLRKDAIAAPAWGKGSAVR